jgi:hypothetical protein
MIDFRRRHGGSQTVDGAETGGCVLSKAECASGLSYTVGFDKAVTTPNVIEEHDQTVCDNKSISTLATPTSNT